MDAHEAENAKAQAVKQGHDISELDAAINSPWQASADLDQLTEPLDFSWLAREFDFPEDMEQLNPDTSSDMEQLMAQLESELNAPLLGN